MFITENICEKFGELAQKKNATKNKKFVSHRFKISTPLCELCDFNSAHSAFKKTPQQFGET